MNSTGKSFNEVMDYVKKEMGLGATMKPRCCQKEPILHEILKVLILGDP